MMFSCKEALKPSFWIGFLFRIKSGTYGNMFNNRMIEELNTQLGISQPEDQETLRSFTRQRSSELDRSTGKIIDTGKSKVRLCPKTGNILPKKKEILVSSLDALNVKSVKKFS
jgi:hypothetical protein